MKKQEGMEARQGENLLKEKRKEEEEANIELPNIHQTLDFLPNSAVL